MTKQIKNRLTGFWAIILLPILVLGLVLISSKTVVASSDVVEDNFVMDGQNYGKMAETICDKLETVTEIEMPEFKENIYTGPVLNKTDGVNYGPNGKETYYNLNMQGVVARMHRLGYVGEYWIRKDGVKMFGDYVMVAANLKKFPRGGIVDTSLGKGIVVDTGGFVYNGSGVVFDIAVNW